MRKFILAIALTFTAINVAYSYGPTGHRTVAKVADNYLTDKAKAAIEKLLDGETLIMVSTFADDIKSDRKYDYTHVWHYVNSPDSISYEDSEKNPDGDMLSAINESISILKDKKSSKEEKAFRLKMLVHLMGDLHQPMHAGHKEDRGGNDIKVKWFGKDTNLHRVWDSNLIEGSKLSYSELAENMPKPPYYDVKSIEKGSILDWYAETKELSSIIYASAKADENLRYDYSYKYFPVVRDQLNKGGIRLAKVLNEIFN
jgi:hypothetical protein